MRARSGQDDSARAFEEILDRYEKRVFNLAKRLMGDHDEASDVTQEAFVRAFRAMGRFRRDSNAYTWLARITVNTCRNRFRQRDRKRRHEAGSLDEDLAGLGADGSAAGRAQTPHAQLEQRELNERIVESLQALSDEHRTVVVLRDFEGLSYKEIAQLTGATIENVKTRIFRGRSSMREKLLSYLRGTDL